MPSGHRAVNSLLVVRASADAGLRNGSPGLDRRPMRGDEVSRIGVRTGALGCRSSSARGFGRTFGTEPVTGTGRSVAERPETADTPVIPGIM